MLPDMTALNSGALISTITAVSTTTGKTDKGSGNITILGCSTIVIYSQQENAPTAQPASTHNQTKPTNYHALAAQHPK